MDHPVILKPQPGYWFAKYLVIIFVASLLPFSAIYWDLEMPVYYALMGLFLVVWIMLCYTYIDTLFATKWIITKDELIFRHGIISRREEHLELYRVIDYSEKQNFLQLVLGNKTVKVISGDASDPVLYMYGIDRKIPVIETLRDRVKVARKESGIFEVTNRT